MPAQISLGKSDQARLARIAREAGKTREEVDMKKVIVAARKAVRAAVRRHKLLGQSIAVWEDGKVVIVPASRIKV